MVVVVTKRKQTVWLTFPFLIIGFDQVNGGSLAEKAGLRVGDALIRVNSSDIFQLRHKDAQDAVSRAGNNFELVVSRSLSYSPSGRLQRLRSNAFPNTFRPDKKQTHIHRERYIPPLFRSWRNHHSHIYMKWWSGSHKLESTRNEPKLKEWITLGWIEMRNMAANSGIWAKQTVGSAQVSEVLFFSRTPSLFVSRELREPLEIYSWVIVPKQIEPPSTSALSFTLASRWRRSNRLEWKNPMFFCPSLSLLLLLLFCLAFYLYTHIW